MASALRWGQTFSSRRPGFESLSGHRFLWFHWHLSAIPIVHMAKLIGQQGSEAVCIGSNPSLYLQFLTLLIRRKNVIPLLCLKIFTTRIFLKPEKVPLWIFRHCETNIQRRIVIPSFLQKNLEISGGIDICRKPLITRFKTLVSFLNVCKVDQNICSWAKNMPVLVGRFVQYYFTLNGKKNLGAFFQTNFRCLSFWNEADVTVFCVVSVYITVLQNPKWDLRLQKWSKSFPWTKTSLLFGMVRSMTNRLPFWTPANSWCTGLNIWLFKCMKRNFFGHVHYWQLP